MEEKKPNKLKDIKDTASSAAEIMRQIGTPGVLESLKNVRDTTAKVSEIIQGLQSPEMVKNIENFLLISENINSASTKIQNSVYHLKESGLINESSDLIKSINSKFISGGDENNLSGNDLQKMSIATKEMFISIKDLMNELTKTVVSAKSSDIFLNTQESIKDISDIHKSKIAC